MEGRIPIEEEYPNFDPSDLVNTYFGIDPTPTQRNIINDILSGKHQRISVLAMTRYGKSFIISAATLLYAVLNDNKRVIIVSPTYSQSRIIMEYISNFVISQPAMIAAIDFDTKGAERLKKEVSRSRVTLKNGSEIRILSGEGKGERLMGFGADLIVEDESALISDEVFRLRISRMLGDNPKSILIEIGNPFPGNHFSENWQNPKWRKYKIDYKVALKEGRVSQHFIDEQRALLTPMEFTILYEADFPTEMEDSLVKWAWIEQALYDKGVEYEEDEIVERIIGCDIAEAGVDWTVITKILKLSNGDYIVEGIEAWHKADTMKTAGKIVKIHKEYKSDVVRIDAIGVGKGVYDRLQELRTNKEITGTIEGIKVGMSPKYEKDRFLNKKAELYWNLRTLFEDGKIFIPKNEQLVKELRLMRYDLTSSGKIKIIDPEAKSPDYSDSLMLGLGGKKGGKLYIAEF